MDNDGKIEYQAGGPVSSSDPSYIFRKAETEAIQVLRKKRYLLLIEPRQQGKTSLLFRLMEEFPDRVFVYIDVSTLDRSTEEAWYTSLCSCIVEDLEADSIIPPGTLGPLLPSNHEQWRRFIHKFCQTTSKPVVLALDEIGAAVFPNSSGFFAVIRAALTARGAHAYLERVTFVLAGAFHPSDLIRDKAISPFNVAKHVRLPDFTFEEVQELVQKAPELSDKGSALAKRIHFWTDGQPYLTQLLCLRLMGSGIAAINDESNIAALVDDLVEVLIQEGEGGLKNCYEGFAEEPELARYFQRILGGAGLKFHPAQIRLQAKLELLGLVKNQAGNCVVRNEYYRRAFEHQGDDWVIRIEYDRRVLDPQLETGYDAFICYRRVGGADFAHTVKKKLEKCGLRVFLDVDNLEAGPFPPQLYHIIEATPGFVLLLSPGSLDKCKSDENDWVRKEAEHALYQGRKIVPLLMNGFEFPSQLPEKMEQLRNYQSIDLGWKPVKGAFRQLCRLLRSSSSKHAISPDQ